MSDEVDVLRSQLRALVARLIAICPGDSWGDYARAWLDGALMAGRFVDSFTHLPATPLDFVRDAQAGTNVAVRADKQVVYERARAFEDAAWAVAMLEHGDLVQAHTLMLSAARRAGLEIGGGTP